LTIQSNRTLGGYGACLVALSIISTVISFFQSLMLNSLGVSLALSLVSGIIAIFSLIGIILVLIAMSGFASDYQEPRIMNNIWKAIITIIIGVVIIVIVAFAILILNLSTIIPSNSNNGSTLLASSQVATTTERWIAPIFPIAGFMGLIAIVFVTRSLNVLAEKSEVSLFRVSGKVLLASILVTIVIGIIFAVVTAYISVPYASISFVGIPGGIIQEAAWILLAMAFFRIKPPVVSTQPIQTMPSVSLPVSGQVKYCTYCGSQNPAQAIYCTHCGQKM
jgi:uncharacterized membrane protein